MTYVFVGGSQRSGTSVMQQLLCQSPLANPYLYEASYLRMLVSVYRDSRNSFNRNMSCYFGDEAGLREFSSLLVRAFLEHSKKHLGGHPCLILKEPHLTQVWPELYELVPESIFLLMVRDPRDVIASMVAVGEKQKQIGQNYLFTQRNIPQLCEHMISFYAPVLNIQDSGFRDRLAIVLYENLVSNPRQTLKEVSGFTGLDFESIDATMNPDTGLVRTDWIQQSALYSPWSTEVSGQKVSDSRVGLYKSVLTPTEIAQIEQHCEPFFEWFCYDRCAA